MIPAAGERRRAGRGERSWASPGFAIPLLFTALSCGSGPAAEVAVPVVVVSGAPSPVVAVEPSAVTDVEPETGPPAKVRPIVWESSDLVARERAEARKAPIVVFVFAEWSPASAIMERRTWSNPRVAERARSFVALRLDVTRTDANAQADIDRFGVDVVPATLLLDLSGREVLRLNGFTSPDDMLAAMNRVDPGGG